MQRARSRPGLLVQLVDLLLIELTNWRWSWRTMLITSVITPLASMVVLSVFARDSGSEALTYVLTGNIVLGLMFGNLDKIQSHFVYLRLTGGLDYFATLPIQRYCLVLAMVAAFLVLSLPALLITVVVGSLFVGVPLHPSPMLLLVVPLCAVPLAGIGALIGASARTPQDAGALSLLVTLVMVGLGPVVIPADRLPDVMRLLGYLSPATYAASAFRQTLIGPVGPRIALDLAVLTGLSVLLAWLLERRIDWRQR